jgi:hypothetical protein
MKRPPVVWIVTFLLLAQLAQLSWTAAHTTPHGHYKVGPWQIVALGALLTVTFTIWPRVCRWYVSPYLFLVGLMTASHVFSAPLTIATATAAAYGILWIGAAVLLFRRPLGPR